MKLDDSKIRLAAFAIGTSITIGALIAMASPLAWLLVGLLVCGISLAATWRAVR